MQFHLNGFEPGEPDIADPAERVLPSGMAGPVPAEVDVLIVGCGPAGLTLAAQLAAFPDIKTCIVEQKAGPLQLGQADGIACRTMEMFEAFGFSERVLKEAYWVNETTFWKPDESAPETASSAAAAFRTPRTACRNSRMSSSTRRACTTSISTSCAIRRPSSSRITRGACSISQIDRRLRLDDHAGDRAARAARCRRTRARSRRSRRAMSSAATARAAPCASRSAASCAAIPPTRPGA